MKDLGRGLATAGIWLGIGMLGLGDLPAVAMPAALFGAIATIAVWFNS